MWWWALISLAAETNTTLPVAGTVRLRSAFDGDPSHYLGRFMAPVAEGEVDETRAMATACSPHITFKRIPAGGVTYDELLEVNRAVAARFHLPLVGGGSASHEDASQTRVQYTLTAKLVAEVADPAALVACCTAQPDQCTERYVGEFLEGTGQVFRATSSETSAEAQVQVAPGSGAASVAFGHSWEASMTFTEPTFFAFRLNETPFVAKVQQSCPWVDAPPAFPGEVTFVGHSGDDPQETEEKAREKALKDVRAQAAKRGVGVEGPTGIGKVRRDLMGTSLGDKLKDRIKATTSKGGIPVTEREWCVERVQTADGTRFEARVLATVADG